MSVQVANAPVSFGVFELTEGDSDLADPDELASAVAATGYAGIDSGPIGYLGTGDALRARLTAHHLALCGGFVQLRFACDDGFDEDLAILDGALDMFDAAAGATGGAPPPKPTLADAGSPDRWANPGRGRDKPELGLSEREWRAFGSRVDRAAARVREHGLEPTFHHHACTYVEAPHEVERLLELTDVGLCLDTGHLLLGGGDPVTALRDWGGRINHLHVKDARLAVMRQIVEDAAPMVEVWRRGAFCEFGKGDVDIDGFVRAALASGYAGWLVVEQDRMTTAGDTVVSIAATQRRNRERLRALGVA